VLDRQQIGNMAEKLRDWCANVENTVLMAQSHDVDMVLRREE
jgi:energy-coupling factor transporter ATP-binding protein EcfA2